jgi:hypothetical protein
MRAFVAIVALTNWIPICLGVVNDAITPGGQLFVLFLVLLAWLVMRPTRKARRLFSMLGRPNRWRPDRRYFIARHTWKGGP